MHAIVFIIAIISLTAFAILPLPYGIVPWDTEYTLDEQVHPRTVTGLKDLHRKGKTHEMELPQFVNPENTLGYNPGETFQVPKSLQDRVEFWKKIYTQYSSQEAVLHDSSHLHIIYDVMDISSIQSNNQLSYRRKMQLINRMGNNKKREIRATLKTLHTLKKTPLAIPLETFSIFRKFDKVGENDKYLKAGKRIRMQLGLKDHIVKGFIYSGRYLPEMMKIFESYGVPKELTRLPFVETAFNLKARSKAGASGVWQFIPSTGKRFLKINEEIDERNDPIAATHAAAKLLKQNYLALGYWPLAVTAYNHGKEGMRRAIRQLATTDLSEIIDNYDSRTFGFASSNFYAEFLAILEIERDYRKYYGKMLVEDPLEFEKISLSKPTYFSKLVQVCKLAKSDLEYYNPALNGRVIRDRLPVPTDYELKVPRGAASDCNKGI